MRSAWTTSDSVSPAKRCSMKSSTLVASGSTTRSTEELLMSRSCQSARFSSAAPA